MTSTTTQWCAYPYEPLISPLLKPSLVLKLYLWCLGFHRQTPDSGCLPPSLGIHRDTRCFAYLCPSRRVQNDALDSFGPQQLCPWLRWRQDAPKQLKTMLMSSQAPCFAKVGDRSSSLSRLPSKLLWTLQNPAQTSAPYEDQKRPFSMCVPRSLFRYFTLTMVTLHRITGISIYIVSA